MWYSIQYNGIPLRDIKIKNMAKLPKKGTGLRNGNAGQRRAGRPRTEAERQRRHNKLGKK